MKKINEYTIFNTLFKDDVQEIFTGLNENNGSDVVLVNTIKLNGPLDDALFETLNKHLTNLQWSVKDEMYQLVTLYNEGTPLNTYLSNYNLSDEDNLMLFDAIMCKLQRYDSLPKHIINLLIDTKQMIVSENNINLNEMINFSKQKNAIDYHETLLSIAIRMFANSKNPQGLAILDYCQSEAFNNHSLTEIHGEVNELLDKNNLEESKEDENATPIGDEPVLLYNKSDATPDEVLEENDINSETINSVTPDPENDSAVQSDSILFKPHDNQSELFTDVQDKNSTDFSTQENTTNDDESFLFKASPILTKTEDSHVDDNDLSKNIAMDDTNNKSDLNNQDEKIASIVLNATGNTDNFTNADSTSEQLHNEDEHEINTASAMLFSEFFEPDSNTKSNPKQNNPKGSNNNGNEATVAGQDIFLDIPVEQKKTARKQKKRRKSRRQRRMRLVWLIIIILAIIISSMFIKIFSENPTASNDSSIGFKVYEYKEGWMFENKTSVEGDNTISGYIWAVKKDGSIVYTTQDEHFGFKPAIPGNYQVSLKVIYDNGISSKPYSKTISYNTNESIIVEQPNDNNQQNQVIAPNNNKSSEGPPDATLAGETYKDPTNTKVSAASARITKPYSQFYDIASQHNIKISKGDTLSFWVKATDSKLIYFNIKGYNKNKLVYDKDFNSKPTVSDFYLVTHTFTQSNFDSVVLAIKSKNNYIWLDGFTMDTLK